MLTNELDKRNLLFNILDALFEMEFLLGDREPEVKKKIRLLTQLIITNENNKEEYPCNGHK